MNITKNKTLLALFAGVLTITFLFIYLFTISNDRKLENEIQYRTIEYEKPKAIEYTEAEAKALMRNNGYNGDINQVAGGISYI